MSRGILDPWGHEITNPNDPMIKVYEDKRSPTELSDDEWGEIHGKLTKAFIKLIIFCPIIGRMVSQMAELRVWVTAIDEGETDARGPFRTMATDGKILYIWPQFVLYHPLKEVIAVLLHELYHNALTHIDRGLGFDPYLRNIAMDITVNNHVNDAALEKENRLGSEMKPELYGTVDFYVPVDRGYAIDHTMRDDHRQPLPWEEVYIRLLEKLPKAVQDGLAAGGRLVPGDFKGKLPGRTFDDHDPWRPGNRPADADGNINTDPFDPRIPQKWAIDANAASSEKLQGFTPAGIKRVIDELINPPIPWFRLLSNYMEPLPGDVSWVPGDLRMDEPAMWCNPTYEMKYIVDGFDTSGSMSNEEIAACVNQTVAQISGFPNMDGRLYFWDAAVHDRMDVADWRNEVPREVHGGGGTSIIPSFKALEEEDLVDKTKVVVQFTDGYIDWDSFADYVIPRLDSREYPFDVVFVFTNKVSNAPSHPKIFQTRLDVVDHY